MRVPPETSVRTVEGADGGFRAELVPLETSIRGQAGALLRVAAVAVFMTTQAVAVRAVCSPAPLPLLPERLIL